MEIIDARGMPRARMTFAGATALPRPQEEVDVKDAWRSVVRTGSAVTALMAILACSSSSGSRDDDDVDLEDTGLEDVGGDGVEPDGADPDGGDPDVLPDVEPDAVPDVGPDVTDVTPDDDIADDVEPDVDPGPTDWPEEGVVRIVLDGGATGTGSAIANLGDWAPLENVDFASNPAVRCWDNRGVNDEYLAGPHIPFVLDTAVPEWSSVTVTVTPDETNAEAVFYVLVQEPTRFDVPPAVEQATYCHRAQQFGGPGNPSSVTFQTYAGGERNILIGVSNRGRFRGDTTSDVRVDVEVEALTGEDRCYDDIVNRTRWPENVRQVRLDANGEATVQARLEDGAPVCGGVDFIVDATCAPATRLDRFGGNHVFFAVEGGMPRNSVLTVTAVPNPDVDISLYASRQGFDSGFDTPPSFTVAGCEASYDIRPGANRNPGATESVLLTSINNPFNVFVAVAGDDLQGGSGEFLLSFRLVSYETDLCTEEDYSAVTGLTDWPAHVTRISGAPGVRQVTASNADGIVPCTLDWAASSQNACFPATRFSFFRGATQYFVLDPPPPAGATVRIRAVPDPDVEVSLFGYRLGPDDVVLPPAVAGVQCEASYTFGIGEEPNPGEVEEIRFFAPNGREYTYLIGVAAYNDGSGGDDILTGNYRLQVDVVEPPPPHCPESLPGNTWPAWPSFVRTLALTATGETEKTASLRGDLADGSCVNLNFAASSQVACFPATQFSAFEGNHVFHTLSEPMPPGSELFVTVRPDPGVEVNVYGLQMGDREYLIPPAISSAICRSSLDYTGPNPGEPETIRFANPTPSSQYNVMIAVAGDAATGTSGGYTIEARLVTSRTFCEASLPGASGLSAWPSSVTEVSFTDGAFSRRGNLSAGACTNLDFAARSDVACFPSVRFDRFEGNHVFYALSEPLPPRSSLTITAIPDADLDVNLYGLLQGPTEYLVPPAVTGATCRAGYSFGVPNPGVAESITFQNPSASAEYNLFFAVAAPEGVTSGGFTIEGRLEQGTVHCEESLPGVMGTTWPGSVRLLRLDGAGQASASGNLRDGACTNLAFAAGSALACFPGTLFSRFEGNHVFYALADPLPPNRRVRVSARSTGANDVNLYGYTMAGTSFFVPPLVPSGICEYRLDADVATGPHAIEFDTGRGDPPNLFFAVAGEAGVTTGAFDVQVELLPL